MDSEATYIDLLYMFRNLATVVVRFWPFVIIGWIGLLLALGTTVKPFNSVVEEGEFAFLPDDSPSLSGEALFKKAWKDSLASRVVIVARRESHPDGLLEQDRQFIDEVLKTEIEAIAQAEGGLAHNANENPSEPDDQNPDEKTSIISRVRTFSDKSIGRLLDSEDNKATLIIVELTTEFLDSSNGATIEKVEELIVQNGKLDRRKPEAGGIPYGLALATSGDATVGRDMMYAAGESVDATELWTVILVVVLLILIYRAPGLALIPLLTVGIGTEISLHVLTHLADWGAIGLFQGIQIYVKVLCYGAGVDYCLFLIARYKEEIDNGADYPDALHLAISKVGSTLTASAFTVICGIGMMRVAEFGKFQQAGIAIALGLFIVLCTSLTFTPALLRLTGSWAFWPKMPRRQLAAAGWISPTNFMAKLMGSSVFQSGWKRIGQLIAVRPGTVWLTSVGLMMPFAILGISMYGRWSYGLLSELPRDNPSVLGAKAIQDHYPAGIAGPVTMLLKHEKIDFSSESGVDAIRQLSEKLKNIQEELDLADIRSVAFPYGISKDNAPEEPDLSKLKPLERLRYAAEQRIRKDRIVRHYVSHQEETDRHVTRFDVVFKEDPFSRNGIHHLNRLQTAIVGFFDEIQVEPEIEEDAPDQQPATSTDLQEAELYVIGPTASIRDLKNVTDSDQIRIDIAVIASVFLVLILLLRRPTISLYLIVSVFFSYLATLGATWVVFWFLGGADFAGLDWKVPIFLFAILIAVGEDYNIFLMTRIDEEQTRHDPIEGLQIALQKTGSIISSCGIIMAGTFSSLLAGTLVGMQQLGFALAFGVLLDTFVVRPILVPAYLVMLYRGQLGVIGKLHLADGLASKEKVAPVESSADQ